MTAPSSFCSAIAITLLWAVSACCDEALKVIKAHEGEITALAFSPDGRTLVSAGVDGHVIAWDVKTGRPRCRCARMEGKAFTAAFSPDAKRFASAGTDSIIRVWDAATGKLIEQLKGHEGPVAVLAYSPDGKLLASGGYDRTIRLWPTGGGESRVLKGIDGRVTALVFTADGRSLVSGGAALSDVNAAGKVVERFGHADRIHIWDVTAGKLVKKLETRGSVLALLPGERVVAAGIVPAVKIAREEYSVDGTDRITVVDLKTGKGITQVEFSGMTVTAGGNGSRIVAAEGSFIHLAGNILLANNGGPKQKLERGEKLEIVAIDPGKREQNNVIFCNGGGRVDHRLSFRDPATLKEQAKFDCTSVSVLAFSPDERFLALGSASGEIRLLDEKSR
jgi:WD40 repeat protein